MKIVYKLQQYLKTAYKTDHFPSVGELRSGKPICAYYGFLGDGNFGDELVYEATKKLFEHQILLPIRRFMPIHLLLLKTYLSSRFSGLVIGGGTLIGPVFWEKAYFKSIFQRLEVIFTHGTGVKKKGEYNDGWKLFLSKRFFGGVRGPKSVLNLKEIEVSTIEIGDAAFYLYEGRRLDKVALNGKTILLNLGTHVSYTGDVEVKKEIRKVIEMLFAQGFQIKFFPCHDFDINIGNEFRLMFPQMILLEVPKTYQEAKEHFDDCTFAIGERLHFVVMSLLMNCPFFSINYGEKHVDLLQSVGSEKYGYSSAETNYEAIMAEFNNRSSVDWDMISEKLSRFQSIQAAHRDEYLKYVKR